MTDIQKALANCKVDQFEVARDVRQMQRLQQTTQSSHLSLQIVGVDFIKGCSNSSISM
jgi:hypothetical protein